MKGGRRLAGFAVQRRARAFVFLLVLAAGGCSRRGPSSGTGAVTFNKDVAPVLHQHCAPCHHPGQAAPFSLLTYADARKHAQQVVELTSKRLMPPWLPEPGCGPFLNERRLSASQIRMLQDWLDGGLLEGDESARPVAPAYAGGWQEGEPALVVEMTRAYTMAADGPDVYRNFVLPIPIKAAKYVKAVEFLPGNARPIHHAFLRVDPTGQSRLLEGREAEPGFSFLMTPESAQIPEGHFMSWVPGKVASPEPEDLAWRLTPGTDLVLQLHMVATGKPEPVQPRVGFYFSDKVPTRHPIKVLLTSRAIDIPAGAPDYAVQDEFVLPTDIEVLAVMPHAHYLGKEMKAEARLPDGSVQLLMWIRQWNFSWQSEYRYATRVRLPKNTRLSMRFTYDNSTNNVRNPHQPPEEVRYGPQTRDEMAEFWMQVVPQSSEGMRLIQQALQGHTLEIWHHQYRMEVARDPGKAEAHNGLAKALLGLKQPAEATAEFEKAVELEPKLKEPHFYLGYLYRQQRRLPDAQREYQNVVALDAADSEAHGNLGLVVLEQGDPAGAAAEFREALRLNPQDSVAKRNLAIAQKLQGAR